MSKLRAGSFILVTALSLGGLYYLEKNRSSMSQDPLLQQRTDDFRKSAEERLRSPTGWLTVVGLHWLKENSASIGSAPENKIILPAPTPEDLGEVFVRNDQVFLELDHVTYPQPDATTAPITIDGTPAQANKKYQLVDDTTGEPTLVKIGPVTLFALKRKNGLALRVRDENSEARKNFKGRNWFPATPRFVISAIWVAHMTPRTLMVPDILGNINEETSPGYARFQLNGNTYELHPTVEKTSTGDKLFFVFRDLSSVDKTYGAARFLYADMPKDDRVLLDFNQAVNPPCAFTNYATCPMPPKENILKVAILAGELKPRGH